MIQAKCGFGKCTPDCLQKCANMKLFCMLSSIANLFSSTLTVYVSSQITTLEKQFGFSSSQSGFLMSAFNIGYLSAVLFVTFFTERVHKPRAVSIACFLVGISALICSIAYFASPLKYDYLLTNKTSISNSSLTSAVPAGQICQKSTRLQSDITTIDNIIINSSSCESNSDEASKIGLQTDYTSVAMAILTFGLIIQGMVQSPMEPYLVAYIDNNVKKTKTAAYLGVLSAVTMLGPAIGYGLGAYFSQIHVSLQEVGISSNSRQWIGAWWLGFVVFGILTMITSTPLLFFPNNLKGTVQIKDNNKRQKEINGFIEYCKEFYFTVKRLLENKFYVVIILGVCLDMIPISGLIGFTPKYIETQFGQRVWMSSILTGVLQIIPVAFGVLAGGLITSKKKFSPVTCIKFLIVISIIDVASNIIGMILGCPTPNIIGYNTMENYNTTQCITNCHCSDLFFPVCGSDQRTYLSPCHAGCTEFTEMIYAGCSCVSAGSTVTPGLCSSNCKFLIPYVVTTLIFKLISPLAAIPAFIILIRSVAPKDKGIAIGFASFTVTLLGWLPGPVLFGKLIDQACILWSSKCDKGACALYDNKKFRLLIYGTSAAFNVGVVIFKIIQLYIAKRKTDWYDEPEERLKGSKDGEALLPQDMQLSSKNKISTITDDQK